MVNEGEDAPTDTLPVARLTDTGPSASMGLGPPDPSLAFTVNDAGGHDE